MERLWLGLGSLAGLAAVAMAALAAHGLDGIGPVRLQMARNALQMQGWHALALLACGLWARRGGMLVDAAGAAFTLGLIAFCGAVYAQALIAFCGAVYAQALGGLKVSGVAPAGGLLLMLGWLLLGVSTIRVG